MKILIQAFLLSFVLVWYAEAQWVQHPTYATESLYGVHFVSKDVGFAAGWDTIGRSVILHTNDKGNTWNKTYIDSLLLFGIHSLSDKHILIAGYDWRYGYAAILETTDGGHEWKENHFPENFGFYGFAFPSATTGYVCGYNGDILQTNDAGATWVRLETGTGNVFRGITFPSVNVGFAFGGREFNLPDQIYKTTNGGETWEQQQDFSKSRSIGAMYFRDEMTGFHVGSDYKTNECIYKTTDGGATWINVYSGPNKNIVLQGIDFASDMVGYAVGSLGRTLRTTDGGDSWEPLSIGTDETLLALDVSPSGEAFTVSDGGLLFSYAAQSGVHASTASASAPRITYTSEGVTFRFASSPATNAHLHLYDILGREIRDETPRSSEYLLSGVSSGSYLWKYDDGSGKTTAGVMIVS